MGLLINPFLHHKWLHSVHISSELKPVWQYDQKVQKQNSSLNIRCLHKNLLIRPKRLKVSNKVSKTINSIVHQHKNKSYCDNESVPRPRSLCTVWAQASGGVGRGDNRASAWFNPTKPNVSAPLIRILQQTSKCTVVKAFENFFNLFYFYWRKVFSDFQCVSLKCGPDM